MPKKTPGSRLVRVLPKGQITLPIDYRRRLGIDGDAILRATLTDRGIELVPLPSGDQTLPGREYSRQEIDRFLREDRLDRDTATKVHRLLNRRRVA